LSPPHPAGTGDGTSTGQSLTSTIDYIRFGDMLSPEVDHVASGHDFNCFRFRITRVVRCIGAGPYGEHGTSSNTNVGDGYRETMCAEAIPFNSPGHGVVHVSTGSQFTCAQLDGDGAKIRCVFFIFF
jgi:hypothetical protein